MWVALLRVAVSTVVVAGKHERSLTNVGCSPRRMEKPGIRGASAEVFCSITVELLPGDDEIIDCSRARFN